MIVRTKGNENPKGKPRIFFACYPPDHDRSYDAICNDIFRSHDAAVYSLEEKEDQEQLLKDLIGMNLFVIPVSFDLLMEHSFAMDQVLPLCVKEHIPVLPIMIERGIDYLYKRDDKFGTIQYLDMTGTDRTAVDYRKKLKDYLDAVLVGDELASRVRKAFDAYVFLSYRKKDRAYANELMRLIHKDPVCRDIAIWYDEYLVPGEKFDEAIVRALKKSRLFTLLVTPNLVNEKSYVQTEEYPRARKSGIGIFPVEMEETDHERLEQRFPGVPGCVSPNDEKLFRQLFKKAVGKAARSGNDTPEHDFLIGLAYLDGIDVETDRIRAVKLITKAADAGLPEAVEKLSDMYYEGIGVERNLPVAISWEEKLAQILRTTLYDNDPKLVYVQNELGFRYADERKWDKAIEMHEAVYKAYRSLYGEENPDTLEVMDNLAFEYDQIGDQEKAFELHKRVFKIRGHIGGYSSRDTLNAMYNMVLDLISTGQGSAKMLKMAGKLYKRQRKAFGPYDRDSLCTLEAMAHILDSMGKKKKATKIYVEVYEARQKTLGENNIETITSFKNFAVYIMNTGNYDIALEMLQLVHEKYTEVMGPEHPETTRILYYIAQAYTEKGEYEKALSLSSKAYEAQKNILGKEHPYTQEVSALIDYINYT